MADPTAELTRVWLLKAHGDLHTAVQIGSLPDGHLDVGIYHCQQAAEKALKGYLLFHDVSFEKTHDLKKLVRQAEPLDGGFDQFREAAAILTPYIAAYRYPDEFAILEPSRAEFDDAVRQAQTVYDFVLNLLPKEARP
ncbi:MAG TPA: HEPN domain-containing protein [Verrucomicrobiae bacterium]|jgi:HEPN domain-containing protein|nr:HEPN domain-containing protein [Verrucomicrobiae bacterium]